MSHQITAKVIEHSKSGVGAPDLITLQLAYPRFIHSEFMTHRLFSRNAASSRAIPVAKMIEQVRTNPAMPVHWGKNQPGMQAHEELQDTVEARQSWQRAARQAADLAEHMNAIGLHKQVANRILEPFQIMHVIVTATEWDNFFALRDHEDAEPNIRMLAQQMRAAIIMSNPRKVWSGSHLSDNWHLPYVTAEERAQCPEEPYYLAKLSAARCARVSYLTHEGKKPDPQKDLDLYERLVGSEPLHASPIEHQAYPDRKPLGSNDWFHAKQHGNFVGWVQLRKTVEEQMRNEKAEGRK